MSGRGYNGMNAVILKLTAEKNKFEIPVWATFNRLTSLNYQKEGDKVVPSTDKDGNQLPRVMVNKGEKSTPVFLPTFTVVNKETKEKIPYEDYKELDNELKQEYNVYPKLMVYNVFNLVHQPRMASQVPRKTHVPRPRINQLLTYKPYVQDSQKRLSRGAHRSFARWQSGRNAVPFGASQGLAQVPAFLKTGNSLPQSLRN